VRRHPHFSQATNAAALRFAGRCLGARKGCGGTLISAKRQCRRAPFCGLLLGSPASFATARGRFGYQRLERRANYARNRDAKHGGCVPVASPGNSFARFNHASELSITKRPLCNCQFYTRRSVSNARLIEKNGWGRDLIL